MASYSLPNTAFGNPNFGVSSTNNNNDQIAAIGVNVGNLQNITGAITSIPTGPSGSVPVLTASNVGTTTVSNVGNDLAGVATYTGITGSGVTGVIGRIAFAGRTTAPSGVVVSGPGAPYASSVNATGFSITVPNISGTAATYSYLVIG